MAPGRRYEAGLYVLTSGNYCILNMAHVLYLCSFEAVTHRQISYVATLSPSDERGACPRVETVCWVCVSCSPYIKTIRGPAKVMSPNYGWGRGGGMQGNAVRVQRWGGGQGEG